MHVLHFARRSAVTAAAIGLVLSACSDSSGPDVPFDPAGTSADVAAANEAFESPTAASYSAVSAEISAVVTGSASPAVAAAPSAAALTSRAGAARYAQKVARLYARSSARPSFSTAAAISEEYLGTTFVWDVDTDQYVASELSGAPADGIRFRLYAINPVTGKPAEPLNDVGLVEIVATETSTASSIRAKVISGAITYLDYTLTLTSTAITISGYATNGDDRAEFAFALSGNESALVLDYVLEVPTRDFRIEMEIGLEDLATDTPTITLDFEARGEHGTVSLEGSQTDAGGSYTVEVNGDRFATITIDGEGVAQITGADGHALTADEVEALENIFRVFEEASYVFDDLVNPIF